MKFNYVFGGECKECGGNHELDLTTSLCKPCWTVAHQVPRIELFTKRVLW